MEGRARSKLVNIPHGRTLKAAGPEQLRVAKWGAFEELDLGYTRGNQLDPSWYNKNATGPLPFYEYSIRVDNPTPAVMSKIADQPGAPTRIGPPKFQYYNPAGLGTPIRGRLIGYIHPDGKIELTAQGLGRSGSSSRLIESAYTAAIGQEMPIVPSDSKPRLLVQDAEEAEAQSAEEEPDEEWSDVEYDVPTASFSSTRDSLLAVPAFADDKRALIGKLLTPVMSKDAIRLNATNHPGQSGVNPDSILLALQSYVDLSAVSNAIARHNSQNPSALIGLGTKPVDAVFVEAIHQFQAKCYKRVDSKQRGVAGPSVLDSLGFWPRTGLLSSAQTNEWAKKRVHDRRKEIEKALSTSTDLTRDLTQSNWWTSFD
jgi:hypothetical protein